MEYEFFEPDPADEYYDEMCSAAYALMFSEERSDLHECFQSGDQLADILLSAS